MVASPIFKSGFASLRKNLKPNADTLSSAAILASLIAGRDVSALTIIWLADIAELLTAYTMNRTRKAIHEMLSIGEAYVWLLSDDGTETKAFDVRDGHGIKMLKHAGIETVLISGRSSPLVEKRAADLGIEDVAQGVRDKVPILESFLEKRKLSMEVVAFVGDDVVDISLMTRAGFAVAVADASEHLFDMAHYVTLAPGGRGAVREVAELILGVQGKWQEVTKIYFS